MKKSLFSILLGIILSFFLAQVSFAESSSHKKETKKAEKSKKDSGHKKSEEKSEAKKSHSKEAKPEKESEKKAGDKERKKEVIEELTKENIKGEENSLDVKKISEQVAQLGIVDAVLVIDSSRSMQKTDPEKLREQAAKLFIRLLSEGDRLAILNFDKQSNVVLPLTEVKSSTLEDFDKAISSIPYEGGFTDIQSAIAGAGRLLLETGRKDVAKTVLLLSDGKMDAHPERGEAEDLIRHVEEVDLPVYRENKFKLYTVALSELADKDLLKSFSEKTEGVSLYAADPSAIHKRFSELFFKLKQPQLVTLEGEDFEIDTSVKEATFFISRNEDIKYLTLVDPLGNEIEKEKLNANVKWYTDERIELITIYQPLAGHWKIKSNEKLEGFARLLTDLKLHVQMPVDNFQYGESIAVYATLINKDDHFNKEDLNKVTFYTYKLIDSKNGEVAFQGVLNDQGEKGDKQSGDGIYSTVIKLDKNGEFQALFGVTAPTFTRQQKFSLAVAKETLNISLIYAEAYKKKEETIKEESHAEHGAAEHKEETLPEVEEENNEVRAIQVKLSDSLAKLQGVKVRLILKQNSLLPPTELLEKAHSSEHDKHKEHDKSKSGKNFVVTLQSEKQNPKLYTFMLDNIKPADYEAYAYLTAKEIDNKEVTATTTLIKFSIEEKLNKGLIEVIESSSELELVAGISSVVIAIIWILVLGLSLRNKYKTKVNSDIVSKEARITQELKKKLESVKQKPVSNKRRPIAEDKEVFGDALTATDGAEAHVEHGVSTEHDAHKESEQVESTEEGVPRVLSEQA